MPYIDMVKQCTARVLVPSTERQDMPRPIRFAMVLYFARAMKIEFTPRIQVHDGNHSMQTSLLRVCLGIPDLMDLSVLRLRPMAHMKSMEMVISRDIRHGKITWLPVAPTWESIPPANG